MFYLVCFDIVDDRARNRVARCLKSYGERVQKSVFECSDLTEERFLKMKARLESLIDEQEDSIRYYGVCRSCLKNVELSGIGEPPKRDRYQVV